MMEFKDEDRGFFSTRRSCNVYFPPSHLLGRVIIKTSNGKQNNSVCDAADNILATFETENRMFHSKRSLFMGLDGQEIGRMKHARRGLKMEIEFTEACSVELKVLLMAAAYLFHKQAEEARRRRAAAAAS